MCKIVLSCNAIFSECISGPITSLDFKTCLININWPIVTIPINIELLTLTVQMPILIGIVVNGIYSENNIPSIPAGNYIILINNTNCSEPFTIT